MARVEKIGRAKRALERKKNELGEQSEWGRVMEPVDIIFDAPMVTGLLPISQEGNWTSQN